MRPSVDVKPIAALSPAEGAPVASTVEPVITPLEVIAPEAVSAAIVVVPVRSRSTVASTTAAPDPAPSR